MRRAAVVLAAAGALGADAPARAAVTSYPGPGWGFASPATTITFRNVPHEALAGLAVTGSRTGEHSGRLHGLRLAPGAVFTPDAPFAPGERVTVAAPVPVTADGRTRFTFTTARPAGPPPPSDGEGPEGRPQELRPPAACRLERPRLRTLPGLVPEPMCARGRLAPGHGPLLITPKAGLHDADARWGAAILSDRGRLQWYFDAPYPTNDLKVVELAGRRLLALFLEPRDEPPHHLLLDEAYQPVGRITAGNGFALDSHDLQVSPRGSVYVGADPEVRLGPRHRAWDYVVQEVDPETGDVLFEWHALDHVPLRASYRRRPAAGSRWDPLHGNSIEPPTAEDRTILVSLRNTSAVYGIQPLTGRVKWVLGGRRDQFGVHRRHRFCAQHDARRLPNGDVLVFDNGGLRLGNRRGCPVHPARVLRFRLDMSRRRARVVRTVSSRTAAEGRGTAYLSWSVGSARRARDGSVLVNWGNTGRVTEHDARGRTRFRLAMQRWTYRAVRAPWTGRPAGPPAVVARRRDGRLHVWVSWNGATEVRRWRVLLGDAPDRLTPAGRPVPFAGLETHIRRRAPGTHLAVEALGADGEVLGRFSGPVAAGARGASRR